MSLGVGDAMAERASTWIDLVASRRADGPKESAWPLSVHQLDELAAFCNAVSKYPLFVPGSTRVIAFGSAARGRAFPFSDVDVAVVSTAFVGMPWGDRMKQLKGLLQNGSPISPIGTTDDELARGDRAYPSVLRSLAGGRSKPASEILVSAGR